MNWGSNRPSAARRDGGLGRVRVLERQFVEEQGVQRPHANHVVVECAACDGGAGLLGQNGSPGLMAADDGLGGLARLACGEGTAPRLERLASPDQQIDPATAVRGAQANMVGRAFVGQMGDGGQGVVDGEPAGVREQGVQRALGLPVLQTAVQIGVQVGGGEMHPTVCGVAGRGSRSRRWRPTWARPNRRRRRRTARFSTRAPAPVHPCRRTPASAGRGCRAVRAAAGRTGAGPGPPAASSCPDPATPPRAGSTPRPCSGWKPGCRG